jgi:hypothetical protein
MVPTMARAQPAYRTHRATLARTASACQRWQVFVAALGGTSWRVKRVAEQQQSRDRQRRIGGRTCVAILPPIDLPPMNKARFVAGS